jgi:hypothetical protein
VLVGPTAIKQVIRKKKAVPMRTIAMVFALTSFLSAFLLFQVQLIVSKYILPWFGGSAAVWTTSMLVFQILLLGGYAYSHLVSKRLSPRAQTNLHLGLLAAVLLLVSAQSLIWPSAITPGPSWKPLNSASPVREVAVILLLAAGLPFFVLSATSPLLQRWFARAGGAARTYRLYSVSNLGSLAGLLSFPFLLEPTLRMRAQGRLWALLFGAFVAGCAWCAWRARNSDEDATPEIRNQAVSSVPTTAVVRTLWFLLAACASALLLATTNQLCQEITSIPLLWVVPLSLYLLSFILCFDHPRWYRRDIFHPLFAVGVFALWTAMHFELRSSQLIITPVLLFITCMICHGELVRLKPVVQRLTSFYLSISAGGVLGGVFVAIVAPHIFSYYTEFQLCFGLAVLLLLWCLFRDEQSWMYRMGFWLPAGIAGGAISAAYLAGTCIPGLPGLLDEVQFYPLALLVSVLSLLGAYLQRKAGISGKRSFRAGQVLVVALAVLLLSVLYESAQAVRGLSTRNFYGVLRIEEQEGGKVLFHGQTVHGAQPKAPNNRLPVTYYGPKSGIGILLQNYPRRVGDGSLRFGVVGLGAGTLAAYGLPGDYLRYYEINPDVIELAAGAQPTFTYIRDSQAKVDIEQGDARLLLEYEAARGEVQNFDVLVLDAFSGDAVPVHLLTTEAFDTYWKHVNARPGVIAIHISTRHVDLLPVIEGIAEHYNASMLVCFEHGTSPFLSNLWVFLARHSEDLQVNGLSSSPPPVRSNAPSRVWTDDYSNIIRLLF